MRLLALTNIINAMRDPEARKRRVALLFMNAVERLENGCWLWRGAQSSAGYGACGYRDIPGERTAHRVSWHLHRGPIPDGRMVLHTCDVKLCVNPEHLYLGDGKDNASDRRQRSKRAHGPKLSADDVRAIRSSLERHVDLAARYGVTRSYISVLKSGRYWAHL